MATLGSAKTRSAKANDVTHTPNDSPPSQTAGEQRVVEPLPQPRVSPDEIAQRAYVLFLERGGAHGYDLEDWLRAERDLKSRVGN